MNAAEVMSTPVVTVSPSTPVPEIARLLVERRISGVPVVGQDGELLGMVSEADLLRLHGADEAAEPRHWWQRLVHPGASPLLRARLQALSAADVMTRGAISVGEYAPLAEVAAVLVERHVHRVTVLSGRRVVGIITGSDMMRALLALSQSAPADWRADAEIESRLGAALERLDEWNPLNSHLSVDRGIVWFRGTVQSEAARDAARLAAERTPGVCGVLDDRVCVGTAEPWSAAQSLEYVNG